MGSLAGLVPARTAHAAVRGIISPGSIVYIKEKNVWLTSPDGTTQRQLSTDGATFSAAGTGNQRYAVPGTLGEAVPAAGPPVTGPLGANLRHDSWHRMMHRMMH